MKKLNLLQTMALNDIQLCYDKIINKSIGSYEKSIMGMFAYVREKKLFNDDFFEYWFIKFLNSPISISYFYLDEPSYKIFGFNEKSVSTVLTPHLIFLKNSGYDSILYEMLTHALNNKCVLEQDLFNTLMKGAINETIFLQLKDINSSNLEYYLNKNLSLKNDIKAIKI